MSSWWLQGTTGSSGAARPLRRRGRVASVLVLAAGCSASEPSEPTGTDGASDVAAEGADDEASSGDDGGSADTEGKGSGDDAINEDGTGAPLPEFLCEDRNECVLHSDCCSCVAVHADQEVPACADESCERGLCEVWGIDRYLCSHTCHIELVECDAEMVTCSDPPPECEAGMAPSVDERCWSNHCVPEELCRPV